MRRNPKETISIGLLDGEETPSEPAPKSDGLFQKADSLLASKGYPSEVIREFNLFLSHYCKRRGKPPMEDVVGWVYVLDRHIQWKFDWDDVSYVLRWSRLNDKYYVAIPPEMGHGGSYWFEKGRSSVGGQKSKKVYV